MCPRVAPVPLDCRQGASWAEATIAGNERRSRVLRTTPNGKFASVQESQVHPGAFKKRRHMYMVNGSARNTNTLVEDNNECTIRDLPD